MKPIAILGSGPSALMAAHACALARRKFAIFSKPVKSKLGGAQYLHKPIPDLSDEEPDTLITMLVEGTPEVYRKKVYGESPFVPFVSMEFVEPGSVVQAWNLGQTYEALWTLFSGGINPAMINHLWLEEHKDDFSMIISSIPKKALCALWADHRFVSQSVQIYNQANNGNIPDNTIWYNGTTDSSWYRMSKIFGVGSTEYPATVRPPVNPLVVVEKPVATNCKCFENDVLFIGRFGRWEKGVLSHDGFDRVSKSLAV